MNKNILKQFTFGFEIEGNFAQCLGDTLPGKFKEDGSVGSEERLSTPNNFETYLLNESDQCGNCDGEGQYREDCECEGDTDCEHSHELSCYTTDTLARCENRYGNISLSTLTARFRADNCDHDCAESDCPSRYPCEDDEDYHLVDCLECEGSGEGSGGKAQEYASKKFMTMEDMLKELNKFKSNRVKPTHIWNKTCGLHIHVGKKPSNKLSYKQIWNATCNMDFLRALHDQASQWCDCQRKRLYDDNDHYYQFWKNPLQLIKTYQHQYPLRNFSPEGGSEKFRFLRFHNEFKTLEFRFLSPCQHKVENVEKLLSFLTDYLGDKQEYNSQAKVTDEPIHETLKFIIPVNKKQFTLEPQRYSHPEFIERTI